MHSVRHLDHWAHNVQKNTRVEMQRIRRLRAGHDPVPSRLSKWRNLALSQVQAVSHMLQGGMPAVERLVMRLIVPNTKPEHLLPHAAHHQP